MIIFLVFDPAVIHFSILADHFSVPVYHFSVLVYYDMNNEICGKIRDHKDIMYKVNIIFSKNNFTLTVACCKVENCFVNSPMFRNITNEDTVKVESKEFVCKQGRTQEFEKGGAKRKKFFSSPEKKSPNIVPANCW